LGFRHSSETKQYLRDLQLGKPLSQETRNKLSSVFSGIKNPFYGKKHSEESKVLMSENKQGENNPMYGNPGGAQVLSQQLRDKSGDKNPMWGKSHSEETRKKLSTPIYVFDYTTKNLIAEFLVL
jgi:group I intron endonuclease